MDKINKRLLIADDDFDYLFPIKFKLEKAGFEVVSANSQKEAQLLIDTEEFDAYVFDLMMENDDSGFVLAYHAKLKNPDKPVVITTGVAAETGISFSNVTTWIKADLYLEKGVQTETLAQELLKLLGLE